MPGYAVKTVVPVSKTRSEIEQLVMKRGALDYTTHSEAKGAMIAFSLKDRRIVFRLPFPKPDNAQDVRSRWRGLLLTIKAKFESIDRGVETFDQAFLAHVMTDDGRTIGWHAEGQMKQIIANKVPLLPPPGNADV